MRKPVKKFAVFLYEDSKMELVKDTIHSVKNECIIDIQYLSENPKYANKIFLILEIY